MPRRQIFIIHGGMTFKTRKDYLDYLKHRSVSLERKASWTGEYLDKKLGKQFAIIRPRMPLQDDAHYEDWKIYYLSYPAACRGDTMGFIFPMVEWPHGRYEKQPLRL